MYSIDLPMRAAGIVAIFVSSGSILCAGADLSRTSDILRKLKKASDLRPRNEYLKMYYEVSESIGVVKSLLPFAHYRYK